MKYTCDQNKISELNCHKTKVLINISLRQQGKVPKRLGGISSVTTGLSAAE